VHCRAFASLINVYSRPRYLRRSGVGVSLMAVHSSCSFGRTAARRLIRVHSWLLFRGVGSAVVMLDHRETCSSIASDAGLDFRGLVVRMVTDGNGVRGSHASFELSTEVKSTGRSARTNRCTRVVLRRAYASLINI